MKYPLLILTGLLLGGSALAQECTPEATQQLGSLMTKVTHASKEVDGYLKRHKVDSREKSDLIMFCLNHNSGPEFKNLFKEAAPAVNNLEEFGNRQTGACKDSALRASQDLENNVRRIMTRFEECKKNQ